MSKYYSISIPKPCHEDWNAMTPKEKGRHCVSCAKTVIDFTKMNTHEIQDFMHQNKHKNICGHFKQTQLDSINIHIPSKVLENQISFHKAFLIALLLVMGTTLMNCTNKNGTKKKIDSIEVVDTTDNTIIDVLGGLPKIEKLDSLTKQELQPVSKNVELEGIIEMDAIDGEVVITTVGDVETIAPTVCPINDSLNVVEPPIIDITGITTEKPINDEIVLGFVTVQTPPLFKDTPKHLSNKEQKDYFSKKVSQIVTDNFNQNVCIGLKGRQRIQTQFKIDSLGQVVNIKVRAPHPTLEAEAKRVIRLLPEFIPAKQRNKPVAMIYYLPIVFQVDE